jgi:N-acetylmuramoyl-L-alanine amidase
MRRLKRLRAIPLALPMLLSAGLSMQAWAATRGDGPRPPAKPDRSGCSRAQFRVVLDVGHSAEVPGAKSARGVPEYEFNLSLARRIEKTLTGAGFKQTLLLVTPGPARAGLFKRVARANALPADLFISVHHDSVPEWFLEVWTHGGKEHGYSDKFSGHSLFISYENGQAEASFRFAQLLGKQLKANGLRYTPHYTLPAMDWRRRDLLDVEAGVYRYDQLVVLRETKVPAVLLEAGSIVNREEELLMSTPERQTAIAGAVTKAVEQFCAASASAQLPKR